MSKHTPGPWYVDEDLREGMAWNRHICDSGNNRICFMAHSNGRTPERDEANARLIASAPDLLSTLRAILAVSERHDNPSWNAVSDSARAALAKAEGRP